MLVPLLVLVGCSRFDCEGPACAAGSEDDTGGELAVVVNDYIRLRHGHPKNVIVMSIDTLRRDHLNVFGYGTELLPRHGLDVSGNTDTLDRFFTEGLGFVDHRSCSSWTLPSFVCFLSGMDQLTAGYWPYESDLDGDGVSELPEAPDELRLLSEVFQERGYYTMLMSGSGFLGDSPNMQQGYDEGWGRFAESFGDGEEYKADYLLDNALEMLDDRAFGEQPFYLHLHFMEPHAPWIPPESYLEDLDAVPIPERLATGADHLRRLGFLANRADADVLHWAGGFPGRINLSDWNPVDDEPARYGDIGDEQDHAGDAWRPRNPSYWVETDFSTEEGTVEVWKQFEDQPSSDQDRLLAHMEYRYDMEIRFADDQVQRLLDYLERHGLFEDTVVLLMSDHGEEFFEHGNFNHGYNNFDEQIRVQAAFYQPGNIVPAQVDELTLHQDLAPTLFAILGWEREPQWSGLVPGTDAPRAYVSNLVYRADKTHQAVTDGQQKLMFRWDESDYLGGPKYYYELSADPTEQDNAYDSTNPDVLGWWDRLLPEVEELDEREPHAAPAGAGP